jgi:hypothetical protein
MPKTPDELIQRYKDLYNSLPETSDMERSACTLYVSIFEKLKRKMRLNQLKVVNFIRDDFKVQDKKRLQFGEDEQTDDAYLCAQIQQAYRIFWVEVLDLPLDANLCAQKVKPMFMPMDLSPRVNYMGIKTGRV